MITASLRSAEASARINFAALSNTIGCDEAIALSQTIVEFLQVMSRDVGSMDSLSVWADCRHSQRYLTNCAKIVCNGGRRIAPEREPGCDAPDFASVHPDCYSPNLPTKRLVELLSARIGCDSQSCVGFYNGVARSTRPMLRSSHRIAAQPE